MGREFQQSYTVTYPFSRAVQSTLQKYPNPFATHVVSVDTLSSSLIQNDTVVRLERLIGVRQNAPKWVQRLLGGSLDTYVREISFINLQDPTPSLTQHSVNLSLTAYVSCKERVSYIPARNSEDRATRFSQTAKIEAQGRFAEGEVAAYFGRKVEDNSWERFDSNAHIGKEGYLSVLKHMWGEATE